MDRLISEVKAEESIPFLNCADSCLKFISNMNHMPGTGVPD